MTNSARKNDDLSLPIIWIAMAAIAALGFVFLLTYGWGRLLVIYMPNSGSAWTAATLIAVFAFLLAVVMGAARAARLRAEEEGRPRPNRSWLALYPFLFFLSALGLLNTAVYLMEGSVVLREQITRARENLSALRTAAPQALRDPSFEAKEARVRQLLPALNSEIHNPHGDNSCGVGPKAREVIAAIRVELPGFHEYAGRSEHACNSPKLDGIYQSYKTQAEEMLASDPAFARDGGHQKRALAERIESDVDRSEQRLIATDRALAEGSDQSRASSYDNAKTALSEAATVYGRYRHDPALSSAFVDLPQDVDVDDAQGLGSLGAIIPTLIHRLSRLSTWGYIVFALIIDIGLVLLLATVLLNRSRQRSRTEDVDPWAPQSPGVNQPKRAHDPTFLWVNQRV